MAELLQFDEHDFYSDNEEVEDFSKYLTDVEEEIDVPLNGSDIDELDDDFATEPEKPAKLDQSLLDSLLGEALSDQDVAPPVEGLFDDLDDSEPEEIDGRMLEDIDSGITTRFSDSADSDSSESVGEAEKTEIVVEKPKNRFDLSTFLQFMTEEEHAVPADDLPDFASKKNVYGTTFNVQTGSIHRPPRFEFARRDARWIDSCKELTYDKTNQKSIPQMLALGKRPKIVKFGEKIDVDGLKATDVYLKTADEMATMETSDIQKIIRDAFNARRFAVVLLGIDADQRVSGCKLSAGKGDYLRLAVDTAVQTEFVPPIENVLDAVDVHFLTVLEAPEPDRVLIVVRVKQIRNRDYRLETAV